MSLSDILKHDLHLILFGGKGGVGKSTCAAATALHMAKQGRKTLVMSSDPAPSLSDSFGQQIGGEIKQVEGVDNLFALEIDVKRAVRTFKEKYGEAVIDALSTVIPVDRDLLEYIPSEAPPGLDEAYALDKIMELMDKPLYDLIIWDTAPTGHTLRLLSLPNVIDTYTTAAMKIRYRLSGYIETLKAWFGKESKGDKIVELLEELKKIAENTANTLRNAEKTEFILVMIPEAMCLYQTERLHATLREYGIHVKHAIINGIIPSDTKCNFCLSRRKMQEKYIREIYDKYSNIFRIVEMPLYPTEIRGLQALSTYSEALFRKRSDTNCGNQ